MWKDDSSPGQVEVFGWQAELWELQVIGKPQSAGMYISPLLWLLIKFSFLLLFQGEKLIL